MTAIYPVIYTRTGDKDDTYLVSIPDIDGATEGYGLKDAISMARDYIANYLVAIEGESIPSASNINTIDPSKGCFADAGESFVSLVDVETDTPAYRHCA